jgi:uncharacterized integral membrane protein
VAGWVFAIALLSVQNFTPVSLHLFTYQSVEIPIGIVLALAVGVGILGTAIAQILLKLTVPQENLDDNE